MCVRGRERGRWTHVSSCDGFDNDLFMAVYLCRFDHRFFVAIAPVCFEPGDRTRLDTKHARVKFSIGF